MSQTILDSIYTVNTQLSVSDSPYSVQSDITIDTNAILEIENGVEIIFMADYRITVRGAIVAGCNDIEIDTSSNRQRGLADDTVFTYIHSDNTTERKGSIDLYTSGFVEICNAKIQSLQHPFRVFSSGDIYVDNSEFIDNHCAISYDKIVVNSGAPNDAERLSRRNDHEIYDSIFEGNFISVSGTPYMDNIEVRRMPQNGYLGDLYYSTLTRSTINGAGATRSQCISLLVANNVLSNNEIINCNQKAIYLQSGGNTMITNNVIRNNEIGLYIDNRYQVNDIHYNDFIGNTINIQLGGYGGYQHECSLNYFGTDNETKIVESINHLCNGFSSSLAIWWPYYDRAVADLDSSSLPEPVQIDSIQCSDDVDVNGTILPYIFLDDVVTLTEAESPYYVTNDVFIGESQTMTIENGVEIIYTNYLSSINVRGTVDCGCDSIQQQPNDPKARGTYLPKSIHIHGDFAGGYSTGYGFTVDGTGTLNACNTIFEFFTMGILRGTAFVDNCEFKRNKYGIYGITNGQISDSTFTSNTEAIRSAVGIGIENCLFEGNGAGISGGSIYYDTDISVSNSDIIGNWPTVTSSSYCNYIYYRSSGHYYFINNTIRNCYYGLMVPNYITSSVGSSVEIICNSFMDNNVAFRTSTGSYAIYIDVFKINYNNFINNNVAILHPSDVNAEAKYNYFGQDDITNFQIISDLVRDGCDADMWSWDGILQFWPWLSSPVTSLNNIPAAYTINATLSAGCPPTASPTYFVPAPTASPSQSPSPSPSVAPTQNTESPTIYMETCDCNSIELLRIFTSRSGSICYEYQTHFCRNDVRMFSLEVNDENCGLQDVAALVESVKPKRLRWSVNSDGNIQIDRLSDGSTFNLCFDSTQVSGTTSSGTIQYRKDGRRSPWEACSGIANVLPDYCGAAVLLSGEALMKSLPAMEADDYLYYDHNMGLLMGTAAVLIACLICLCYRKYKNKEYESLN